jgi:hypothetical protein
MLGTQRSITPSIDGIEVAKRENHYAVDFSKMETLSFCDEGTKRAINFLTSCVKAVEFVGPHDALTHQEIMCAQFNGLVAHRLICAVCNCSRA